MSVTPVKWPVRDQDVSPMIGEMGGMSEVGHLSMWDAGKRGGWILRRVAGKENPDGTRAFKGDTAHTMTNEEDARCACVLGHVFLLTRA